MGKTKRKKGTGENGLTLVEVLASIVILTLLLTTFLMLFLQSAKVNKASEHIIDATYLAQTEMENIYAVSTGTTFSQRETAIESLAYEKKVTEGIWTVFEKRNETTDRWVKVRLADKTGTMTRIIVEVYEDPKKILRAKMENVLVWKADK
ncbi:hypothetical protein MHZ95_17200 [Sporosarcina sp. ACRSM]|uniref:hypothetical protein n=1 Tax=Sporosarcina sp. ACRSM TaxID=2918216 RepID=UPI001EF6DAB2|nr:hypothetical protein [Sporosarcina sp. ACRSM]MCG7336999.1 hypothetical protein [Sporosarcina sp. ACRSM]